MKRNQIFILLVSLVLFCLIGYLFYITSIRINSKLDKITLRLNWYAYGEHAPFYLALDKGYFIDENIDLQIISGVSSGATIQQIGNGINEFGFADAGTMMQMIEQGVPVKSVAVVTQLTPMSFIFLEETQINDLNDLIGKKIGVISGGSSSFILPALLHRNNINEQKLNLVSLPTPGAKISYLIDKKIDVFLGYYIDQPLKIEADYNVKVKWLPFNQYGVNVLSSAIIVNQKTIRQNPSLIRRFLKAVQKGIKETRTNPQIAANSLVKHNPQLDTKTALKEIYLALELTNTENSKNLAIGETAEEDWKKTLDLLKNFSNLRGSNELSDYYTNEFLSEIR